MSDLSWPLIAGLASTGILMALVSCLVGMRQRVEIPAWWGLYAVWVAVVLLSGNPTPFRTVLLASVLAGILHASTQSILIDAYIANNPWYAEQMQKSRAALRMQMLASGVLIGAGFGALIAGIAWGIARVV